MLFLEDHFLPILEDLRARRMNCDAMVCMASATEVTQLTRFGQFDMSKPASGPMALLKKLRGGGGKDKPATGGAAQMKMLRRLPQLLRFVPGTAQDVRAYFITLQYWLGGSDDNVLTAVPMVLANHYAARSRLKPLLTILKWVSTTPAWREGSVKTPMHCHCPQAYPSKGRSVFCCCAPTYCLATQATTTV
jgi:hypothetical protein